MRLAGVGFSGRVLSSAARKERDERTVPYERLPSEMRAAMTKREYERDAAQVRGSDEEAEGSKEGLLPAIIFCFRYSNDLTKLMLKASHVLLALFPKSAESISS